MVYAVKKFWHYLLANKFIFFVDHQALLYLVNKPCSTGRIVRWFLILLEFDFTVVVKKGSTHICADHLSRMIHGEFLIGVEDDLPDAYLFNIEMVPKWSEQWVPLVSIGFSAIPRSIDNTKAMLSAAKDYKLVSGRLYKEGRDGILRLCIGPADFFHYPARAHQNTSRIHLSGQQTIQSLHRLGVYWPNLHEDAHKFVKGFFHCQLIQPIPYGTLYQVMIAPKWGKYIVEYLQALMFPADMPLVRH